LALDVLEHLVQSLENFEMKKTLVALAALAATSAFAQSSSVTLAGDIDIGYRSVNAPGNYADTKGAFQDGMATTAIFFRATEDMGGGTTANFQWEMNPDLAGGTSVAPVGQAANGAVVYDASNTGATGNNFLSLKNATYGEFKLGRLNTGTLSAWGTGSVFGTKLGSGYGSAGQYARYGATPVTPWNTAPTRFNNAFELTSPKFNNFTARALIVPKVDQEAATALQNATSTGAVFQGNTNTSSTATGNVTSAGVNRAGAQDLSLAYNNGPLNAMIAQQTIKIGTNGVNALVGVGPTATTNSTHKLSTYAANYTMGQITVYGAMWKETQEASGAAKTTDIAGRMLGLKYVMGNIDLMASMGSTNDKLTADVDRKIKGLGANYNMSKRTTLYARYESRDANKNADTDLSTNGVTKTTAVGIKHSF
jgi:predicted porin